VTTSFLYKTEVAGYFYSLIFTAKKRLPLKTASNIIRYLNQAFELSIPPVPPAIPLSNTSVVGEVTPSGVCEPVETSEPV
jgi:hypothetical protein